LLSVTLCTVPTVGADTIAGVRIALSVDAFVGAWVRHPVTVETFVAVETDAFVASVERLTHAVVTASAEHVACRIGVFHGDTTTVGAQ
jgi:hypothetical protein